MLYNFRHNDHSVKRFNKQNGVDKWNKIIYGEESS
jgi:hypothetical protein